jgi:predicted TIM-barrel fold metal-dependent hydrolase
MLRSRSDGSPVSTEVVEDVAAQIGVLPLVDHHVHGALKSNVDRPKLELMLTESDRTIPAWMTQFDSQVGLAIRRWCGPVLGLEPRVAATNYVARRLELGHAEVARRLLSASGIGHYLLETGHQRDELLDPAGMAEITGRRVDEVVRLEAVLEELAVSGVDAGNVPDRFRELLAIRTVAAVGLKSIIAYRHGFDFDPTPPTDAEVVIAAGRWLREFEDTASARVADPVLLRFLLWAGVERRLPIQLHAGYGDPDVELHRCDPLLLTRFIKLVEPHGVDLILLHCYPFHRNAGYLAQVFPHVYFDVGLAVNFTGLRSDAVVAESLELAPFAKILFSSDAWGPPELHYLGALLWRRGMTRTLSGWVDSGECAPADAIRIATMIGRDNARRIYALEGDS